MLGRLFIPKVYEEGQPCRKLRVRNLRRAAGGKVCVVGLG